MTRSTRSSFAIFGLSARTEVVRGSLFINAFRASGIAAPLRTVTAISIQLTTSLLAQGRFLGVLGETFLRFTAKWLSLKVLPIELPVPPWPAGIVTLNNRTISPVAQLFIDCAREVAKANRSSIARVEPVVA